MRWFWLFVVVAPRSCGLLYLCLAWRGRSHCVAMTMDGSVVGVAVGYIETLVVGVDGMAADTIGCAVTYASEALH